MRTVCIGDIRKYLKENLSEEKYLHSLGTAEAACAIAEIIGYNPAQAYLAGLVHDCAKGMSPEMLLQYCQKIDFSLEDGEMENYKVLHAPVGKIVAQEKLGVDDEEVLNAIRWHTLGRVNMSTLEKIVFLADKIEPETRGREDYERRIKNISLANGLECEIYECYAYTIKSLVDRKMKICQKTIDVYNHLLKLL